MIVYDTRWFGNHGIGRYSREIYDRSPGYLPFSLPTKPFSPLDPFILPSALRKNGKSHFFLSPGLNGPIAGPVRFAVTLHDINHIDLPGNHPASKLLYFKTVQRRVARRADIVFTVSRFSQERIIDWAGVDPEKVVVTGNAASPVFCKDGAAHSSAKPYFFYYGNRKPHKNLDGMLEAFSRSGLSKDVDFYLSGETTPELEQATHRLGIADSVVCFPQLKDEAIAELLRGALGLVFASNYEGFGLPILEAFGCGCPVITSNVTSMPEVAGGAALLVDPGNVDEIGAAMIRFAEDAALRSALAQKGLARVGDFSWDRIAAQVASTVSAYAA
jgi:glycosyltransferase involved in cell wall biosynthesis